MEIRRSPYNSPFVPSSTADVYWIARDYWDAPHDSHIHTYYDSLPKHKRVYPRYMRDLLSSDAHKAAAKKLSNDEYQELVTGYFDHGIQAYGRRLGFGG